MENQVSSVPAVLTVELDLESAAQGEPPPGPLAWEEADRLCWALAEDLQRILGPLNEYGFVVLGGLYDLTEILRPGLPMVDILSELYRRSLPDTRFQPQVMAIGTRGEEFPIPAIAPQCRPGSGPLLAIPFLLLGEPEAMDRLSTRLEKDLLEKGRASLRTGQLVQDSFGITALNLSFATFNDLCALMKVQLDNAGFGPLWELLEAALFTDRPPARAQLPEGNLFLVEGTEAFTRFLTFSQWRRHCPNSQDPAADYARFHQLQRQYSAGLAAHGLSVAIVEDSDELAGEDIHQALAAARMHAMPADTEEVNEVVVDAGSWEQLAGISLTEHSRPGLGPVAYTVVARSGTDQVLYYANQYPLTPEAIPRIRGHWQEAAAEQGLELELIQPGDILHGPDAAQLVPWPEAVGAGH
ncbi:hypothetical protein QWY84_09855 [Aquisalimonas lutea]|uniref:hypothetical protein n=1 Tax=Aquisalimonas lutea TaxID=1327750 RepID=UPI0025B3A24E|nr:hypothetical protein [Aquisalimonas lutea]MDN3517915.1 hypothetical protein [Aquisalimonas lutea]